METSITNQLGSAIKIRRQEKSLSQKDLSKIIFGDENHNASISRIENGKSDEVQFNTIYKIFSALGIDILNLIKNS